MHLLPSLSLLILLLALSNAAPSLHSETIENSNFQKTLPARSENAPLKVAIIGAGAGGSAAAFFLGKAKQRFGRDISIDIFDKNDYVGGRSTIVHPYDDPTFAPREAGASVFVANNKNLVRAASEFNLTLVNQGGGSGTGVWDGEKFVITLTGAPSDTDMVGKYGLDSIVAANNAAAQFATELNKFYTPTLFSWKTINILSEALGFVNVVAQTAVQWFDSLGINPSYTRDFVEATTRVNYGQNIDEIHGLGAATSLVANSPLYSIEGGNRKIFEGFVKQARIYMTMKIIALKKVKVSGKIKWGVTGLANGSSKKTEFGLYDYVILATPKSLSGITIINSNALFPPVRYVHLHVTFVATTSPTPQRSFFEPGVTGALPFGGVLTSAEGARNGGVLPDFNSIGLWGTIQRNGVTEYIYKTFTSEAKSDDWLDGLYGKGSIGWTFRKQWDAYPYLVPTTTFPPVKPDDGLFYVNSLEPWISTMETETASGRNVADLLLKEVYSVGICYGNEVPTWSAEEVKTKVYGWDC